VILLRVEEIAPAVNGKIRQGDRETVIRRVSTDTRTLKKGDLFVPLKGDNFDGHRFIGEALEKGASGFLTTEWNSKAKSKPKLELDNSIAVIEVDDTLKAYQDIAHYVRERLAARVVGITGSTGKTSTKDMLASILSRSMKISYPPENYNNEIGVPFTILQADEKTEVIVLEMAMRGLGQIHELAEIGRPDIGVVTNIGVAHFELLGSEEMIFEAKSELMKSLDADGRAVLNQDDPKVMKLRDLTRASIVTFGMDKKADIFCSNVTLDSQGCVSFDLHLKDGDAVPVALPVPGKYNIYNALAAAAVSFILGVSSQVIKTGLERATLSSMRMEVLTTPSGLTILNDAYNAAPDSMKAALETLKEVSGQARHGGQVRSVAILGDMLELGALTAVSHLQVGSMAADAGVDLLITIGEKAQLIAEGASKAGVDSEKIRSFGEITEGSDELFKLVSPGDVILVKASRAMKFENVVKVLVGADVSVRPGPTQRSAPTSMGLR